MTARDDPRPPPRHAYPQLPAVAVGAVVIEGTSVLLVRRRQAPSEGLWAIPGGRVELGETLQQAAEREIREETGITVKAGRPVYVFDVVDTDTANRVRFHYVIIDLMAKFVAGEPCAADDALDARWVDFEELSHLAVSGATLDLLENVLGVARRAP